MKTHLERAEIRLSYAENPQAKFAEAVKESSKVGNEIAENYLENKDVEQLLLIASEKVKESEILRQHGVAPVSTIITDEISRKKKSFPDGNTKIIEFAKKRGIEALECFNTGERLRALSCLAQMLQQSIEQQVVV